MNSGPELCSRSVIAARPNRVNGRIGAAAHLLEARAGAIDLIFAKLADEAQIDRIGAGRVVPRIEAGDRLQTVELVASRKPTVQAQS